ncbi:BON domain-containing protein [Devosia nitrariae]|uniref:BON domain-containing protein n=1 Tax=Devosia nitrariae TaxID=2071872 RepID=A0ABQ5W6C1_9HYPH|nr:BON domain-containing protein [Devosia nitrariae]GLQ55491.1 hypothetical protein GCM10010862_27500 [Devosia nitrariae]
MMDRRRHEDWRWREAEDRARGSRFSDDDFSGADYDPRYPDDLPRGYRSVDWRDCGAPDYRGDRYPRYGGRGALDRYYGAYGRFAGPYTNGPSTNRYTDRYGDWEGSYTTDPYEPPSIYPGRVGAGGYGGRERNFMDKAGDELSSWFGDEEAAERRDIDRRRGGHFGRGPRGYKRSDARITEDVSDELSDDWRLDASDIEVDVTDGEVTLNGTVHSRQDKRLAEDLTDNVSGVRHVQNNLRIEPPQEGMPMSSITAGGG